RPLSPVHVCGARVGGDLSISWVRRTRVGGDSWEAPDVPLAEEREAYEVDVMNGALIARILTITAPSAIYTTAQQIADFGAPQANGRGSARQATV
ncbi:MAG: hypothetical protein H7X92_11450, partial [Chitinophagales bacterium]|nr:hypothetical protein [Hyphomicrobiales bacterium]